MRQTDTLNLMSGVQLTFSIIGVSLTLLGLVWSITWAARSFRKSAAEIRAELGQGFVDENGTLHVYFQDGRTKIMRIENDPWERRKTPKRTSTKKKQPEVGAPDQKHDWEPVNAIFVRNSGRAAVTISRSRYVVELCLGTSFEFEPPPAASPWGDLLPRRLEAGEEIVVLHEKEQMTGFLNGVLRDHRVFQTVYGVYLELGSGQVVFAGPPIKTQASMSDEEYAEVEKRLSRQAYEDPESDDAAENRRARRRYERWHRTHVVMVDDLDPEDLRALRTGKIADRWVGKPRPFTEEEKRRLP